MSIPGVMPEVSVILSTMAYPFQVALVQPKGDPSANTFIFPQGGIEEGESPEHAARRELREELGFLSEDIFVRGLIGREVHELPADRWAKAGCRAKEFVFVHAQTRRRAFSVSGLENWSAVWVRSWDEFAEYTNGSRPDKQILMLRALHAADIWPSHGGARQLLGVEPEPLLAVF